MESWWLGVRESGVDPHDEILSEIKVVVGWETVCGGSRLGNLEWKVGGWMCNRVGWIYMWRH